MAVDTMLHGLASLRDALLGHVAHCIPSAHSEVNTGRKPKPEASQGQSAQQRAAALEASLKHAFETVGPLLPHDACAEVLMQFGMAREAHQEARVESARRRAEQRRAKRHR